MTDKPLTTTREALMAELLIDVDRLLQKVGDLDQSLGETIEKSTKEGASKGYLAASLQLKQLTENLEFRIQEASALMLKLRTPSQHMNSKYIAAPHWRVLTFSFLMGLAGAVTGGLLVAFVSSLGS